MLRTFLYQYKAGLLKIKPGLTEEDQRIMLEIAKTSKEFLHNALQKSHFLTIH